MNILHNYTATQKLGLVRVAYKIGYKLPLKTFIENPLPGSEKKTYKQAVRYEEKETSVGERQYSRKDSSLKTVKSSTNQFLTRKMKKCMGCPSKPAS